MIPRGHCETLCEDHLCGKELTGFALLANHSYPERSDFINLYRVPVSLRNLFFLYAMMNLQTSMESVSGSMLALA